jgi:predicted ArsR family transcriptional regulator
MKPERIQEKLGTLTGWGRDPEGRPNRYWRLPNRRAAALLNAYLMEMAEALDLELEITIRADPESRAYRRGWRLDARLGGDEPTPAQIETLVEAAARLEGLPD